MLSFHLFFILLVQIGISVANSDLQTLVHGELLPVSSSSSFSSSTSAVGFSLALISAMARTAEICDQEVIMHHPELFAVMQDYEINIAGSSNLENLDDLLHRNSGHFHTELPHLINRTLNFCEDTLKLFKEDSKRHGLVGRIGKFMGASPSAYQLHLGNTFLNHADDFLAGLDSLVPKASQLEKLVGTSISQSVNGVDRSIRFKLMACGYRSVDDDSDEKFTFCDPVKASHVTLQQSKELIGTSQQIYATLAVWLPQMKVAFKTSTGSMASDWSNGAISDWEMIGVMETWIELLRKL